MKILNAIGIDNNKAKNCLLRPEMYGTNALMSDYIRIQEKLVWMYSSFLNK